MCVRVCFEFLFVLLCGHEAVPRPELVMKDDDSDQTRVSQSILEVST